MEQEKLYNHLLSTTEEAVEETYQPVTAKPTDRHQPIQVKVPVAASSTWKFDIPDQRSKFTVPTLNAHSTFGSMARSRGFFEASPNFAPPTSFGQPAYREGRF